MTDSGYDLTRLPVTLRTGSERLATGSGGRGRRPGRGRVRRRPYLGPAVCADVDPAAEPGQGAAERLVAGSTMINGAPNMMGSRPVGGFGLSGLGKEGGPEGLTEFQRIQTVEMLRPGIGAFD